MKSIGTFLKESVNISDVKNIINDNHKQIETFHKEVIKDKYAILNINTSKGRVSLCGSYVEDMSRPSRSVWELYSRENKTVYYSGRTLSVKNVEDAITKCIQLEM